MELLKTLSNRTTLTYVLLLLILLIPTFWRMLKPGIFTMHDFHVFRLYEYDKCVVDLQLPCRWAPDAAFGYGQPLFNFYAQLPYVFGEIFRFLGFSVLDTIKLLLILSIILSALSMFLLSKSLWGNNLAAFLSAIIYSFAPYRAVDVYVRGALPEALAFIFFPLITYFFNDYVISKKAKSLLLFSLLLAGLILTHNLSVLMFAIFLSLWGLWFIYQHNAWKIILHFLAAGLLAVGISTFYILPVIAESQFISLGKTTEGYYSFENHFVSLKQLLFSRYWGYGGSLWGDDDRLSLSVGYVQWLTPIFLLLLAIFFKKLNSLKTFLILFVIGWLMLYLTHMKSIFFWKLLVPISYIQFPWRFLGSAIFVFSLSAGAVTMLLKKRLLYIFTITISLSAIFLNIEYFKEDIWLNFSDKEFFSGTHFDDQTASAVNDFWPKYGLEAPRFIAHIDPIFLEGSGSAKLLKKRSNYAEYDFNIISKNAEVQFPIVYFPGWQAKSDQVVDIYPSGKFGLITSKLSDKDNQVTLSFKDTPIRTIGNLIALLFIGIWMWLFFLRKTKLFTK